MLRWNQHLRQAFIKGAERLSGEAITMTNSATGLDSPLGFGRTDEAFAYGADGIVKLLGPGFPDRLGEQEARVAALVSNADGPLNLDF
jgi:hypothetical protein